jgi:hypothetical protein
LRLAVPHCLRCSLTLVFTVPATWYVTVEIRKSGILHRRARCPRETITFATEAEAKRFVRAKGNEEQVLYAGTINPHSPKQLILSCDIAAWLADQ